MTRTRIYLDFVRRVRVERGNRCECCGRTAEEARERALHPHHLLPVAKSGLDDLLATSPGNVLLLCGWCHSLQDPGYRSYDWAGAGVRRGVALR